MLYTELEEYKEEGDGGRKTYKDIAYCTLHT